LRSATNRTSTPTATAGNGARASLARRDIIDRLSRPW
jgi:hypothetical protein